MSSFNESSLELCQFNHMEIFKEWYKQMQKVQQEQQIQQEQQVQQDLVQGLFSANSSKDKKKKKKNFLTLYIYI